MIGAVIGALARRMMPTRAVSDETMNFARSLALIRGDDRSSVGDRTMDDILASANLGNGRTIHIATLSRETIESAGAAHLGFSGLFVFEADERPDTKGINVLGKAASFEAALRLADLWTDRGASRSA